jgi:hypothetical protein
VPGIIEALRADGYTFATVSELMSLAGPARGAGAP